MVLQWQLSWFFLFTLISLLLPMKEETGVQTMGSRRKRGSFPIEFMMKETMHICNYNISGKSALTDKGIFRWN